MWAVHLSTFLRVILFLGTSKTLKVRSFEVNNSGINHNSTCPTSCLNSRCHLNNSRVICTDGCEEGRRGDNCSVDCPPKCSDCSKYPGDSCEELCLDNCEGGCDRYKWQCASCKPGFTGRFCDTCMKGFSGARCKKKCPDYCQDGCRKENGFCSWRDDAYRDRYCITNSSEFCLECESNGLCKHCTPSIWGYTCNQTCPTYCGGSVCNRNTGKCGSCTDGYWGDFCNQTCPSNCGGPGCNRNTGKCKCTDGYWGDICNQTCPSYCGGPGCNRNTGKCKCTDGYWGDICNQTCPSYCGGPVCNRHTGKCTCTDGYWGDFCNQTCPIYCEEKGCNRNTGNCQCTDGYWGDICNQTCPTNCVNSRCSRLIGDCWCKRGYWGKNCNIACPTNCLKCLKFTGMCRMCTDGYWGENCEKICPTTCDSCSVHSGLCLTCTAGYWGDTCSQTCHANCDGSGCYKHKGICRQCTNGYRGDFCNMSCPTNCISCKTGQCIGCKSGYRGHFCNKSCSRHCSLCDRFTGDCYGCKTGYQGGYCNVTCPLKCKGGCNRYTGVCVACVDGYAGRHCNSTCSPHCEICDFFTRYCVSCKIGKKGQFCNCPTNCVSCDPVTGHCTRCANLTFYGDICAIPCPRACAGCEKATGYCVNCAQGYSRVYCDEMCSLCSQRSNCISRPCVHRGGSWLWKVLVGTLSSFCIIAVSVLVGVKQARKVRGSDDEQAEQGSVQTDPPDPHEYHLPSNHYHEIVHTDLESRSGPELDPLSQSLCPPPLEPRSNNPKVITQGIQHLDSIVSNSPSLPCSKALTSYKESPKSKRDQGQINLGTDPLSLPPPLCPRLNVTLNESHKYARRKLQENALQGSGNFHGADHGFLHPTFSLQPLLSQQVHDRSKGMGAHLSNKCPISDHLAINPTLCPRSQMLGGNNEILHEKINQDSYCDKDFISVRLHSGHIQREGKPVSSQCRRLQRREKLEPVSSNTSAQSHLPSRNLLPDRKNLFGHRRVLMEMPSHEPAVSFVYEADEVFENPLYRKSAASVSNNAETVEVGACHAVEDQNGLRTDNISYSRKRSLEASKPNQEHWFLQRRLSDSDLLTLECITSDLDPQIKRSKSESIKGENAYFAFNALPPSFASNTDFIASNSRGMYISPLIEQHLPTNQIK